MSFGRFFLWVLFIILINTALLACYFRDTIIKFKLMSTASISISSQKLSTGDEQIQQALVLREIEKMWEEQLIENLFRGTAAPQNIVMEGSEHEHEEGWGGTAAPPNIVMEGSEHEHEEGWGGVDRNITTIVIEEVNEDERLLGEKMKNDPKPNTPLQNLDDKLDKTDSNKQNENTFQTAQEKDQTNHRKPKMVLVLTQSRHGSTWLMDMLGYKDDAVPVFEPLNCGGFLKMYATSDEIRNEALAEGFDPVKYDDWHEVILARICLCDWYGIKIPGKSDRKYGTIRGLWYKGKRMNPDSVGPSNESLARTKCTEEGSMMVPKTIRYYNMSKMHRINEFGCEDFKVIHLVRDPRAVMNSRMTVFSELFDGNALLGMRMENYKLGQFGYDEAYMTRAADHLCSHHLYNYKLGMNPPPWLKGRYKMVRYEDLADHPQHWTRELLHFIGVKYTAKYQEYVYNLTHLKDRGKIDNGWYGVERQTSEISNSWKEKLVEPHWRTIEKVCAKMMKAFDYKPTFSNSED
ncbi:carbohydrate sulfotransferase 3-like [Bolinopsis microptera]|uniref:carbohydrate sulfotransferase 3-like n=1 Tax=Bolinopsis microptera TaxID=2820187 RepID=UPI00307903F0